MTSSLKTVKEFGRDISSYLSGLQSQSEWRGSRSAFVGVWKNKTEYHIIEPYWEHLPFSQMLNECLSAGTFEEIHSQPFRAEDHSGIDIVETNAGRDKWICSLDPTGPRVEVPFRLGELGRQFAAMAFIAELRKSLLRKRRTTYETRQLTLSGRVKGKILVGPTIRRHLGRGRIDLVECAVPIRTQENRVNQVFRYTLRLCKESLHPLPAASVQATWTWANFCDEILSDVSQIRSTRECDYVPHGLTGFYKEHAHLLSLAKVIKNNHQETGKNKMEGDDPTIKTVPFLLNTWLVFERWVEVRAIQAAQRKGWVKLKRFEVKELGEKLGKSFIAFEPDIVFKSIEGKKIRILDAKYKKYWEKDKPPKYDPSSTGDYQSFRHDVHQILAYQSVFRAERVGIIFPASVGTEKRVGHQEHPDQVNPLLSTLAVCPIANSSATNIDSMLEAFLNNP